MTIEAPKAKLTTKQAADALFDAISNYVKSLLAKESEAAMSRGAAQLKTLAALESRITALEKKRKRP